MAFRGVPFAQPPVGDRRFAPPQPLSAPRAGDEPLDATAYRSNCVQAMGEGAWTSVNGTAYFTGIGSWPGLNGSMSEDCLYLNVFAPSKRMTAGRKLPVLFFIFGGGNYVGGAADLQLDGLQSVAETHDAVVITANYRLGLFGWLGGWQMRTLDPRGSSGNLGMLDQRAALRWANANAAAFGGDPQRLLLFGESQGAAATSLHLLSPDSRGLFTRAAMQSGAFVSWASKSMAAAQSNFDWLVGAAGCPHTPPPPPEEAEPGSAAAAAAAAAAASNVIRCLRALPAYELQRLANHAGALGMPYQDGWLNSSYAATRDGVEVPLDIDAALRGDGGGGEGGFGVAAVPIMLGSDRSEGVAFCSSCRTCEDYLDMTISFSQYRRWAARNFPPPWAADVLAEYTVEQFTPFFAASHAVGDLVVRCPTRRAARVLTGPPPPPPPPPSPPSGVVEEEEEEAAEADASSAPRLQNSSGRCGRGNGSSPCAVFLYSFEHAPISFKLTDGGPCAPGAQGAFHGSEIPFVFHVNDFFMTPPERRLADATWRYWRNFAYSGDPSAAPPWSKADPKTASLIKWPAYTNKTEANLVLNAAPGGEIHVQNQADGPPVYIPRCGVWDRYYAAGQPPPANEADADAEATTDAVDAREKWLMAARRLGEPDDDWERTRATALWRGRRRAAFDVPHEPWEPETHDEL